MLKKILTQSLKTDSVMIDEYQELMKAYMFKAHNEAELFSMRKSQYLLEPEAWMVAMWSFIQQEKDLYERFKELYEESKKNKRGH